MLSRQLTSTEKVLLVILVLILLGGAYYWFVQVPVTDQHDKILAQQQQVEDDRALVDAKAQKLIQMKQELADMDAANDVYVETPDYDNLQSVIEMLNTIMPSTTDYTLNFQPVEKPESGNIVRRAIDMTFSCASYEQARDVIDRLHDGPYRCQISQLAIGANKAEGAASDAVAVLGGSETVVSLTITYFEKITQPAQAEQTAQTEQPAA